MITLLEIVGSSRMLVFGNTFEDVVFNPLDKVFFVDVLLLLFSLEFARNIERGDLIVEKRLLGENISLGTL